MDYGSLLGGTAGLIFILFALLMAIVWFFLPFAVFGVKRRLDQQIAELRALRTALTPKPTAPSQAALETAPY